MSGTNGTWFKKQNAFNLKLLKIGIKSTNSWKINNQKRNWNMAHIDFNDMQDKVVK